LHLEGTWRWRCVLGRRNIEENEEEEEMKNDVLTEVKY